MLGLRSLMDENDIIYKNNFVWYGMYYNVFLLGYYAEISTFEIKPKFYHHALQ